MSGINLALLKDFIEEARDHLDEMESLLLQLSGDLHSRDILNDIFRTVHNIKGGSQLTGLEKVALLAHRLEDLLDLLRQGQKQNDEGIVETLISGRDRIVTLIGELEETQQEQSSVDELVQQLTVLIEGGAIEDAKDSTEESEKKVSDKPAQTREPESQKQEVEAQDEFQEEHDKELYEIFLNHLREQYAVLVSAWELLQESADEKGFLDESLASVSSMRRSANYMNYTELTDLFDKWIGELTDACSKVTNNEKTDLNFIGEYLQEIVRRFPEEIEASSDGLTPHEPVEQPYDNVTNAVFAAFEKLEQEPAEPIESAETAVSGSHEKEEQIPEMEINIGLVEDFIEEVGEHLDEMESLLLELSDDPGKVTIMNDIFRTVHNIKGGSQLTGLARTSHLAHHMEDLLDLLRQGEKTCTRTMVNTLIAGRDRIVSLVKEVEDSHKEESSVTELVQQLTMLINGRDAQGTQAPGKEEVVATASDVIENTLSISRYEEEYDQDLFVIFKEHLQAQSNIVAGIAGELNQSDNQPQEITRCKDVVKQLWSSANYMDYQELTAFYENWLREIEVVFNAASFGETVGVEFINANLQKLGDRFPQLTVSSSPAEPQMPQPKTETVAQEKPESTTDQDDDQILYEKLNKALGSSLSSSSSRDHETLHDVFSEIVTGRSSTPGLTDGQSKKEGKATSLQAKSLPLAGKDVEKAEKTGKCKQQESKTTTIRKSMRVDAEKIDALMNQVGELVVDRSYFFQLFNEMRELQNYLKETAGIDQKELKTVRAFTYKLSEAISALGRTSNELQEGVMKMRMLPISNIFNRYPRLVHDLTQKTNKKVNLVVKGEDTELDKMIVEELSDPLIHIIRNAIDHGIETMEERMATGKPEAGTLQLEAYQESNNIVIEITDDGRGIDLDKVKTKAIQKEIFVPEELERMKDKELMQLILMPGFSTAEKITGTSGRGVGMDVVKKNIEKLNGTLEISSKQGQSTRMRLKIPLTLAIIHALMIRVGVDIFTIPLANVDETVRINRSDTTTVEGVEVIHLRGETLPIFHLSRLFNIQSKQNVEKCFVVIVSTDGKRTGFVVDELMGQEEVVIKPLADYVQEKSGFSGATVIGDGRISLILDVYELVNMTGNRLIAEQKERTDMLKSSMVRWFKSRNQGSNHVYR